MGYSEHETPNTTSTDKTVPTFTDIQILKFVNGDFVVEDSQVLIDEKTQYDAQEYARNRKIDYPDIGDQLDALYHAGVFPANMAARIKETKDKYPK